MLTEVPTRHLTAAETAKALKRELQTRFPTATFSVKSETYSGGASISVRWLDGPAWDDVESLAQQYAGAGFDGSIDLQYSKRHWLLPDGSIRFADTEGSEGSMGQHGARKTKHPEGAILVRLGADFVSCNRDYSPAFLCRMAQRVAKEFGCVAPEVAVSTYDGTGYIKDRDTRHVWGTYSAGDLAYQLATKTAEE